MQRRRRGRWQRQLPLFRRDSAAGRRPGAEGRRVAEGGGGGDGRAEEQAAGAELPAEPRRPATARQLERRRLVV